MKKIFTAALFVMLVSGVVFAQSGSDPVTVKNDNGGFIGIGYINESLAVRVALSDLLSLEGSFGFRAGDGDDEYIAGGRALYILNKYNDFNVYAFGGLSIGYAEPEDGDSSTVFRPSLGVGVEYFLVRNLSISAEMGVEANFQKDWNFGSTYSDWMSIFGFRYYLD